MKYHYVYRITNTKENKHYYGVRSSKVEPKLDLGIKYFSSSKDKEFIEEQKVNKSIFKYKIVKIFNSRKEANLFEMILHEKFNVKINENFYNKINANSKFDVSGVPKTEEHKQKLYEANKGKQFRKGTKQSEQCKKLISDNNGRFWKNKSLPKSTVQKMSIAKLGIPQKVVTCPHCEKSGGVSNMSRYHFDNCKNKK